MIGSKDAVVYAGARSADGEAREVAWWREVVGRVFGDAASDPGTPESETWMKPSV